MEPMRKCCVPMEELNETIDITQICDSTLCEHVEDSLIPVLVIGLLVLVSTIITGIVVGHCCWCYHHKKRKRDLRQADLMAREGGLIVLSDDLKRANQEGRLIVNVSLLDAQKASDHNNYHLSENYDQREQESQRIEMSKEVNFNQLRSSSKSCLLLTDDGYAVLEDGHSIIMNEPAEQYHSPKNAAVSGCDKLAGERITNSNEYDYEELYWEPANQEEELLSQLSKLGLPVIHTDCVEYDLNYTTVYTAVTII